MQLLIILFLSWLSASQNTSVDVSQPPYQDRSVYRVALSNIENPSFIPSEEQLNIALASGISLFEVASVSNISLYAEKNISLLFNADIPYPTVSVLEQNRDQIIESVSSDFLRLSDREQSIIAAVGLFRYPSDFLPSYNTIAASIADSLSGIINKPLYYHSFTRKNVNPRGFSFVADHILADQKTDPLSFESSSVFYLVPSSSAKETLITLADIMEATRSFNDSIIIIPSDWFFQVQNNQPSLSSVLSNYSEGRFISMPLPADKPQNESANAGIILLLLIMAGLIIQYKYQPDVIQYMGRYFFNHSFFVNDILDNRVRSVSPGLILMGIHSILNGIFFLSFFQTFFSDKGLDVLSHYFIPKLANGFELIVIFFVSIFIGLTIHLTSIMWLRLLNREINSFSKAINLYIWAFAFTLIPTAILVFNLHTVLSDLLAMAVSVLYLLTWLISFATASLNAARRLEKYRVLNIIFTIGLYTLIFTSLFSSIAMLSFLFEPIELALNVP